MTTLAQVIAMADQEDRMVSMGDALPDAARYILQKISDEVLCSAVTILPRGRDALAVWLVDGRTPTLTGRTPDFFVHERN